MSRDFDWPEFLFLLGALRWTIVLSLIAFVGGGIGGLVLAIARISSHAILRWLAAGYIGLMQGTPVLMQLFLAYYGLAVLTGIRIDHRLCRIDSCRPIDRQRHVSADGGLSADCSPLLRVVLADIACGAAARKEDRCRSWH